MVFSKVNCLIETTSLKSLPASYNPVQHLPYGGQIRGVGRGVKEITIQLEDKHGFFRSKTSSDAPTAAERTSKMTSA